MSEIYFFHCQECKTRFVVQLNEDPTSSSGSCKICGSRLWVIVNDKGEVVE